MHDEAPKIAPLPGQRLHAMDRLRAAAMFLGVGLHAAVPFTVESVPWAIRSGEPHPFFDVLIAAIRGVRMPLFFLIAGFFAREIVLRIGQKGFIRHRFRRIAIPFVVAFVCLNPVMRWQWDYALSPHAPVHLWFLEYLLIFYALLLVVLWVGNRPGARRLVRLENWFFNSVMSLPVWKPALLAFAAVPMLWFSPVWGDVEGGAGTSIVPRLRGLLYFGLFFLCGWGFHHRRELLNFMTQAIPFNLALAASSFLAMQSMLHYRFDQSSATYELHKLICLYGAALYTWSMLFTALGVFLRWFNRPNFSMRYLADASYWVYLMHMPVVVALQLWLAPKGLGAFLTFACVTAGSFLLLFPSYHTLVRYTFIGSILNGPRARTKTLPLTTASLPEASVTKKAA